MQSETKKPKIVVVGIGNPGYQVLNVLRQSSIAGDVSFVNIQTMIDKEIPDAKNITLYKRAKWTLLELKSYFLEMELSLDNYNKFEAQMQDGDRFYILKTVGCCYCTYRNNIGVVIERDGKEVYRAYFDYTGYERQKELERAQMLNKQRWQYRLYEILTNILAKMRDLFKGYSSKS